MTIFGRTLLMTINFASLQSSAWDCVVILEIWQNGFWSDVCHNLNVPNFRRDPPIRQHIKHSEPFPIFKKPEEHACEYILIQPNRQRWSSVRMQMKTLLAGFEFKRKSKQIFKYSIETFVFCALFASCLRIESLFCYAQYTFQLFSVILKV